MTQFTLPLADSREGICYSLPMPGSCSVASSQLIWGYEGRGYDQVGGWKDQSLWRRAWMKDAALWLLPSAPQGPQSLAGPSPEEVWLGLPQTLGFDEPQARGSHKSHCPAERIPGHWQSGGGWVLPAGGGRRRCSRSGRATGGSPLRRGLWGRKEKLREPVLRPLQVQPLIPKPLG